MKKVVIILTTTVALAAGVLASSALGAAPQATATSVAVGPKVSVQIKTLTKTLLGSTTVRGRTGWITKGGTPTGVCPASSAAGALNAATHGHWAGKYYASVHGIFVTSILGYKPSGSSYWSLVVNGHASSKGICGIKLRTGDRLLFKIVK